MRSSKPDTAAATGSLEGAHIDSCTGPVDPGSPLDTQTVGLHKFTVTATASFDATTTTSVTYRVLGSATSEFTVKQLKAQGGGSLGVTLAGLIAAGTVKVTEQPAGLRTFVVRKTAGTRATLDFTAAPSSQLKTWLQDHPSRKLSLKVSIPYTPRTGKSRTVNKTVALS